MKGIRIFGHPLHAVLTAFPIALLSMAPVWDLVGCWRGDPLWWRVSYWGQVAGLILALPTAATGLLDLISIEEPPPAVTATGIRHMVSVLTALVVFVIGLVVRGGPVPATGHRAWAVALEILGAAVMGLGGWFGGHLVFHHGVGRTGK